jgi:hypothetical protein
VFARLASGAFYETIVPVTFYEIIIFKSPFEKGGIGGFALDRLGKIPPPPITPLQRGDYYLWTSS